MNNVVQALWMKMILHRCSTHQCNLHDLVCIYFRKHDALLLPTLDTGFKGVFLSLTLLIRLISDK